MALVFRRKYVDQIMRGEKTVTRRARKPLVKPDRVYRLRLGYRCLPDLIRVKRVYAQRLGDMTHDDAAKEGSTSLEEFRRGWAEIYETWDDDRQVWVVEFEYLGTRSWP